VSFLWFAFGFLAGAAFVVSTITLAVAFAGISEAKRGNTVGEATKAPV
jgi:hypothetical protein